MKRYGNDYQKGDRGYEYKGEWYKSRISPEELKKQALRTAAVFLLAAAAFVAALSFENQAGRVLWVLLPFVSMCFPLAYGLMGSFSLYFFCRKQADGRLFRSDGSKGGARVIVPKEHEGKMVRSEYEKCVRRPWRSSAALAVLSFTSLAGDLILLISERGNKAPAMGRELLFVLLCAFIFLCSLWELWKTHKIKNDFCV